MKFNFELNVLNVSSFMCTTDMGITVFIDKKMTNSPIYKSKLFDDTFSRMPQIKIIHRAKIIHEDFFLV